MLPLHYRVKDASALSTLHSFATLACLISIPASQAAVKARLNSLTSLFINAATPSVSGPVPDDLAPTLALAQARLRVFMEMSERSLSSDAEATMLELDEL